jgi:hypothetical protein
MAKRLTDSEAKEVICNLLKSTTYMGGNTKSHRPLLVGVIAKRCHISRGRAETLLSELRKEHLVYIRNGRRGSITYKWASIEQRKRMEDRDNRHSKLLSLKERAWKLDIRVNTIDIRNNTLDVGISDLEMLLDLYEHHLDLQSV